jgi:hypothetical protein
MNEWTLEEAVKLVRALQEPARKFNYHICLGGGVLNKGYSEKDVDLYFLSLDNKLTDIKGLIDWLNELWGEPEAIGKYEGNEAAPDVWAAHRHINPAPPQRFRPVEPMPLGDWAVNPAPVANEDPLRRAADAFWHNLEVNAYGAASTTTTTSITKTSVYSKKLKFFRGDDRIDVFILG